MLNVPELTWTACNCTVVTWAESVAQARALAGPDWQLKSQGDGVKQRKDDVLIDVEDVALGHESRMRWNQRAAWVWSTGVVHPPVVDAEAFSRAQEIIAGRGASRTTRARVRVQRPYVLRGLVHCGVCLRKMQGQWTRNQAYYRCRYPREYALANTIEHPTNVYLLESAVIPALDGWLAGLFEPEALPHTVGALYQAQPARAADPGTEEAARVVADCDTKLERYRAALEAGYRSSDDRGVDSRGAGAQSAGYGHDPDRFGH